MAGISAAPPQVIVFTGLPGTGKSTLAEQVARTLRAPAFASDWLIGGLRPAHGALSTLDRAEYLAACYSLLETLITRQLMLGQSAVVDDIARDSEVRQWRAVADRFSARLLVVECICSDTGLHRARIEGRARNIPGWHEVGWDHVERMRAEFPPLTTDRLIADAVEPVAANLRRVLAHIGPGPDAGQSPGGPQCGAAP
jgi:predicted kinase